MENNNNEKFFGREYDKYEKRLEKIESNGQAGAGWLVLFIFAFQLGAGLTVGSFFVPRDDMFGLLIAGIVFLALSILGIVKFILARLDVRDSIKAAKKENSEFIKKYGYERVKREEERRDDFAKYLDRLNSSINNSYFKSSSNSTSTSSSSGSSYSGSSSGSSSQRDYFYDGKGVLRKPGDYFYDGKGVMRKPGDYYFDSKGIMRKPGESFFDGKGDLKNPGESYNDSKGNLRDYRINYAQKENNNRNE